MNLLNAAKEYLVYLQALRLPAKHIEAYRRTMRDIVDFYGGDRLLKEFDSSLVLEYAKINDPFDYDGTCRERGQVFCSFTHWLMINRLIPAWADQMGCMEEWVDLDERASLDDYLW